MLGFTDVSLGTLVVRELSLQTPEFVRGRLGLGDLGVACWGHLHPPHRLRVALQ